MCSGFMSCCRSWVWIHQAPTPLTWVVQYKETLYLDLVSETVILCISVLPGFLKPISERSVLTPIWNYFLVVLSVVFHLTGFVQHQKWSFFFFYQSKHLISNQNWKKKSVEMIVQTLNKKKKKKENWFPAQDEAEKLWLWPDILWSRTCLRF